PESGKNPNREDALPLPYCCLIKLHNIKMQHYDQNHPSSSPSGNFTLFPIFLISLTIESFNLSSSASASIPLTIFNTSSINLWFPNTIKKRKINSYEKKQR